MKLIFYSTLLLTSLSCASAISFGGLAISPHGEQNLNIETGITDMPQGGVATDNKSGIQISGSYMQLKPNESLNVKNATIMLKSGGVIKSDNLVYNIKSSIISINGAIHYTDNRIIDLKSSSAVLYAKSGFIVASGDVRAAKPDIAGTSIIIDPSAFKALLLGAYKVNIVGRDIIGEDGDKILLTFAGKILVGANDKPNASDIKRFAPYLK